MSDTTTTDNLLIVDIPKDNGAIDALGIKLIPVLEYARPGNLSSLIVTKIAQ